MPKTKKTTGRKQRRTEEYRPDTDEGDQHPQSSDDETLESEATSQQQQQKQRLSKKDIPGYPWNIEAELRLADLVKDHPPLYDKRHKDWVNVAAKNIQWDKIGQELEPPATGLQCKTYYENIRTRLGKIMKKKKKKSGAGQPQRSAREKQIMDIWRFLVQHIVRGQTFPSEEFAVPQSAADDGDAELRPTCSHSQPSTSNGQGKGLSRPPTTATATTPTDTVVTKTNFGDAMKQILSTAGDCGPTTSYNSHQRIVRDFACLLKGQMLGIPEESWHEFQIDCLNLVHSYKQRRQLFQQPLQPPPPPPMTWQYPQQQIWHPPQQQLLWHQPPATWQALPQPPQPPQQQPPPKHPPPQHPSSSSSLRSLRSSSNVQPVSHLSPGCRPSHHSIPGAAPRSGNHLRHHPPFSRLFHQHRHAISGDR